MEQFPPAVDGNKRYEIGKVLRDDPVEVKAFPDLLIEDASLTGDEFQHGPRSGHFVMGRVCEGLIDIPDIILPGPGNGRPYPLRLQISA